MSTGDVSSREHLFLLRLSKLHRLGSVAANRAKMVREGVASDYKDPVNAELSMVSYRDIGMSTIDELIETFEKLDQAVNDCDEAAILENLEKLSGADKLTVELVCACQG